MADRDSHLIHVHVRRIDLEPRSGVPPIRLVECHVCGVDQVDVGARVVGLCHAEQLTIVRVFIASRHEYLGQIIPQERYRGEIPVQERLRQRWPRHGNLNAIV